MVAMDRHQIRVAPRTYQPLHNDDVPAAARLQPPGATAASRRYWQLLKLVDGASEESRKEVHPAAEVAQPIVQAVIADWSVSHPVSHGRADELMMS